jgi:hypothetical protein
MLTKTIFLMGAPSGRLEWNDIVLHSTALPPFEAAHGSGYTAEAPDGEHAVKWRLLETHWAHGTSDFDGPDGVGTALFLNTADLLTRRPEVPDAELLSQFYDHSFSIHETSRISLSTAEDSMSSVEDSLLTGSTDLSIQAEGDNSTSEATLPFTGKVNNLDDIPRAVYLRSIIPQTMTVNLIVAILAIGPPRRVTTRHSKQDMDIVELIVGDESRSGFGVTFWLRVQESEPQTYAAQGTGDARQALDALRPRDIILLRTVGLGSFGERVFGQSLRRNLTTVDLLHRQGGLFSSTTVATASHDNYLLKKVQRVRQWMINFVGDRPHGEGGEARGMQPSGHLPPDTQ